MFFNYIFIIRQGRGIFPARALGQAAKAAYTFLPHVHKNTPNACYSTRGFLFYILFQFQLLSNQILA